MLQCLVQKDIPSGSIILADDLAIGQESSAHACLLQLNATPQSELNQNAATQPRGNAVIPEGSVALENQSKVEVQYDSLNEIMKHQDGGSI